jgi:hypothetical protein
MAKPSREVIDLRRDLDGTLDAPCDRAIVGVEPVHPLDLLAVVVRHASQGVGHVDPPDDEDPAVLLDLTDAAADEVPSAR